MDSSRRDDSGPESVAALHDLVHPRPVPIGVSNRHMHLTQEHVEALFGTGSRLTRMRDVSQKGQFACNEVVTVATAGGVIPKVRIIGPVRTRTQVELAFTDARALKIRPPIRDSGNLDESPGCTLVGPAGAVHLESGVIIPMRHVHMSPRDAEVFGVSDRETIAVAVPTERGAVFTNVLVRVHETFVLDFHLDTDEANAAMASTGDPSYVVDQSRLGMDVDVRMARPSGGKKLMTEAELLGILQRGEKVRIPHDILLTPSARDLARKRNIL